MQYSPAAGAIEHRIKPISVVLAPERRIRSKVWRKIDNTERHINQRGDVAAVEVLVKGKAVQVYDDNVGGSPHAALLCGRNIVLAVRAPKNQRLEIKLIKLIKSNNENEIK